jgi:hypothetical protein
MVEAGSSRPPVPMVVFLLVIFYAFDTFIGSRDRGNFKVVNVKRPGITE